jgi:hypothetical protein
MKSARLIFDDIDDHGQLIVEEEEVEEAKPIQSIFKRPSTKRSASDQNPKHNLTLSISFKMENVHGISKGPSFFGGAGRD